MERRAFFAAIASPIIANGFPGPDADLKELHKRYLRAWREGSDREADALTFQLRDAIARECVPPGWREVWQEVAMYVAICCTPMEDGECRPCGELMAGIKNMIAKSPDTARGSAEGDVARNR